MKTYYQPSANVIARYMREDTDACAHIRNLFISAPIDIDTIAKTYADELSYGNEDITLATYTMLAKNVNLLFDSQWGREELTDLALQHSLCPLHFVDYAICFDDETNECAGIRIVHPSHDT